MPRSDLTNQLTLFDLPVEDRVVNVASVPQRSPFRYPGGKTWLVPRIRQWLRAASFRPDVLVEPFAGGAIVGLTVAFEQLTEEVLLVELDTDVGAVWETVLGNDSKWLVDRILSFDLTNSTLSEELERPTRSTRQRAFRTILRNRTFHGGILAPGSRPIRRGENGKGLRSRWYPQTLARRIREIAQIRDRVAFLAGDGMETITQFAPRKNATFFIDPPYSAAGKRAGTRLYTCHSLDHQKLFDLVSRIKGDFLMTYDCADEILNLAHKHGFETRQVAMKNTHHARMTELLISRDLSWFK